MTPKIQNEVLVLHVNNHKNSIYLPLKRSERIKYTCFTFSKNYIIFGATSGGLYVFKRNPCSFWQLIPSKENATSYIAISAFENFVAYATNKGVICIVEFAENSANSNSKLIMRSDDLSDSEITTLCWTDDNNKPTLYIGDSNGRVSFLKFSFLNKSILHLPTSTLMTLDSRIAELRWRSDYLLVSTMTRCYLCDTVKEQFKQIGQQLRDGLYGTCFLKNENDVRIFCARPGSRLWEVDLEAVVHSTHQFKQQLAKPPSSFVSIREGKIIGQEQNETERSTQSFNFIKLYDLLGRYVFAYKKDAIYILNVDTVDVLFWSNRFGDIVDAQCVENAIFLWNSDGDVHELALQSVEQCLLTLYFKKQYDLCVNVIRSYYEQLTSPECLSALRPLCDLQCERPNEEDAEMLTKFKTRIESVAANVVELNSGIYMINNKYLSNCLLDDAKPTFVSTTTTTHEARSARKEYEEFRKRSHSFPSSSEEKKKIDEKKRGASPPNRTKIAFDRVRRTPPRHYYNMSAYAAEIQASENLYLEMGLYNSPFITLASYEILQDSFAELGASFSEKFSESSKNLKDKWRSLENKIKFLKSEKSDTSSFANGVGGGGSNDEIDRVDVGDAAAADEPTTFVVPEPIVDSKKRKTIEEETDYAKIVESCELVDDDTFEKEKAFELFDTIIVEYYDISEKFGFNTRFGYRNFRFNCMPEKVLAKMKKIFNIFFRKELLSEWLGNERLRPLPTDELNFDEIYPPLLVKIFSPNELNADFALCRVLVVFAELLNASTILETVKSFELPCYYLSFCYLMKYFQNGEVLERSNNYNAIKNSHWPLPVYLNAMLLMISLDQLDVFYEMGLKKNVDATYVAYMMLHLEHLEPNNSNNSKNDETGNKYKFIFLTYQYRFCRETDATLCLKNIGVLKLALKIFLISNDKFESCCTSCWFLLPGHHHHHRATRVKFIELGRLILSSLWEYLRNYGLIEGSARDSYSYENLLAFKRLISDRTTEYHGFEYFCYKNQESCKHLMCENLRNGFKNIAAAAALDVSSIILSFNIICSFCYRIPELWKYVPTLQKKNNNRYTILGLQHFVQLEMIAEIESSFAQMSYEDARMILNLKSSLLDGNCLNCGNKIPVNGENTSWYDLLLFILRRLGTKPTLKLLNEFKGSVVLDKRFYRSVILTSIPGIGNELKENVITAVANYHNINPVSPEVLKKLKETLKQDKPDKEFNLEESDTHHWGIMVNMENTNQAICYCCSLPLLSKSLIKEDNGGVMVFSCSHTYHTICLKNKNCTATCLVCDRFLR